MEAGPAWGLAVHVQPSNLLGFELGYEGSKNDVSDARIADDPSLVRHGASGLVKLTPFLIESVRPFVGAGLRATYRLLVDERFAADAQPGDPQGGLFDASFTLGGRF